MPNILLSNWPLKLLALGLAFAIWVSVTGELRIVQDFSLPLEIGLADDRILASDTPTTVTVRLRGTESLMRRFDPVTLAVNVDLSDAPPGAHEVQLSEGNVSNVPRGVEVELIEPDRLSLTMERRLRRDLPVEPAFLGQPPEGFAFYGAEVLPKTILVEGPESEVEPLELLRTNPIRLDQREAPFEVRVGAVPEGTYVRVVDPRPLAVRVEVDAAPVERRLNDVPVEVVGGGSETTVRPDRLDVTLSGPPALVDRIRPDQVRVVADVRGVEPSQRTTSTVVSVEFVDIPSREQARIAVKSISRREVAVRILGDGQR